MKPIRLSLILILLCFGQHKSAYLKSIALPGWGNYSLDDKTTAYIHLGAEAATWIGYFINKHEQKSAVNDFKSYAKLHLNLPQSTYTDAYYETIARYDSYEQYKEYQTRQGKKIEDILSSDVAWKWEDSEYRRIYTLKRKESIDLDRRAKFFFAAMAVNRLVSLITTHRARKKLLLNMRSSYSKKNGNELLLTMHYNF